MEFHLKEKKTEVGNAFVARHVKPTESRGEEPRVGSERGWTLSPHKVGHETRS